MRDFISKLDNSAPAPSGILSAAEDNVRFNELHNAVVTAGITPDGVNGPDTDLYQLSQAMARYASGGVFARDTGAANAYILSTPGVFVMPKAYFDGMMIFYYPGNTNTGVSTAAPYGLGTKTIKSSLATDLAGGEMVQNVLTCIIYSLGLGCFLLAPWADQNGGSGGGDGGGGLPATAAALSHGECYFSLSGSNVQVAPLNGSGIIINGAWYSIPSCGVQCPPTGLSASTLYYFYLSASNGSVTNKTRSGNIATLAASNTLKVGSAVVVGGVGSGFDGVGLVTAANGSTFSYANAGSDVGTSSASGVFQGFNLEASTTTHAKDGTIGVEIKSGDPTRSLVGMAYVVSGPLFEDDDAGRYVASWFNRKGKTARGTVASLTSFSGDFAEVSSSFRAKICCWADDDLEYVVQGGGGGIGVSLYYLYVGFDGTSKEVTAGDQYESEYAGGNYGWAYHLHGRKAGLTDGNHYGTIVAKTTAGVVQFQSPADYAFDGRAACYLAVTFRG